jgi:hypothetical protein
MRLGIRLLPAVSVFWVLGVVPACCQDILSTVSPSGCFVEIAPGGWARR